jgi:hypothetical protein
MSLRSKANKYGVKDLPVMPGLNRKKRREWLKFAIKKTKEDQKKENINEA